MDEHATLATVQASITALSVQMGRNDERLIAIGAALTHHMDEEHKSFDSALGKIETLERSVHEIHSAARVTRAMAAIIAGLAGAVAWATDILRWHR